MKRKLTVLNVIVALVFVISVSSCKRNQDAIVEPEGCTPTAQRTVVTLSAEGRDSAWLQLPCEYNKSASSTKKYPLLVYLNGSGEARNVGNLDSLALLGPPYLMNHDFRFSINYQDSNYDFIVICPQSQTGFRTPQSINAVIDYMASKYRVDASRIYLTGVSAGAFSVYNYLTENMQYANRIAAAVPMSSLSLDATHRSNLSYIPNANVPIADYCGNEDDVLNANKEIVNKLNGYKAGIATFGTYPGKHCCWNEVYDTANAVQNPNIYQWMLQFHR